MPTSLSIHAALPQDWDVIWPIFQAVVRTGDTYMYDPNTSPTQAKSLWMDGGVKTYIAVLDNTVVGTYIIKQNHPGLGSHVANASYMVSPNARGLGVGKAMAEHSIQVARAKGFLSMQFNCVVSTNTRAIKLWQDLGFTIIGTSPKAFRHKTLGLVDTHIMYQSFDDLI